MWWHSTTMFAVVWPQHQVLAVPGSVHSPVIRLMIAPTTESRAGALTARRRTSVPPKTLQGLAGQKWDRARANSPAAQTRLGTSEPTKRQPSRFAAAAPRSYPLVLPHLLPFLTLLNLGFSLLDVPDYRPISAFWLWYCAARPGQRQSVREPLPSSLPPSCNLPCAAAHPGRPQEPVLRSPSRASPC